MLPLTAHWQNSFPHVSSTLSLIGRMIRTVAAERVLIGHMCSLFQQPRRLSSSWLDNGTEFCLTSFPFSGSRKYPFMEGMRDFYRLSTSGWVWATLRLQNIWFYCPEGSDMFSVFPACLRIFLTTEWVPYMLVMTGFEAKVA